MKAEGLEEADRRRKYQGSDEGKRQGTIVDLPFVFIVRAKKAPQEQDRCTCSRDGQNDEGCADRRNPTDQADGKDGKKRRKIEEYEHGSAPIGKFISKGSMRQGDLYKDTPQSMSRQSICHV